MNKLKLKSFMVLNCDTLETLSKALGITTVTLCYKMNEYKGSEFKQSEIASIKERYNLTPKEIEEIFFN
ncbi:hypothetical protein SAMN02745248_02450 [Hathewaya proteolytica DSM 3090]|uniref:Cro/C1-type HTH DNA-binding domain-containing protein n=1 Tax=Hathewaya proteolytica DSM 3090 TaxID=1121331 RepID=A0A1M6S455_9CLOT|nr:hypothetical protein [Hathewaya proteolytica]SHK39495.1 hypothetical protein SAMN02745248_02450 [Hathewaya proteolytica DSM 3090]